MENTSENRKTESKQRQSDLLTLGILAHVDAGKTTLSEGLLYLSGSIRKLGRVDNQDAFLDTDALERARGITIFSKQAQLHWKGRRITLLDTPGHVDFSAEMERTLQVLDAAVLVISGADGVQGHTRTLWYLLKRYGIPTFVFINKMDQNGTDKDALLRELKGELDEGCVDFSGERDSAFYEEIAVCGEEALEAFLERGTLERGQLAELVARRKLFPCYFGSALRLTGVDALLDGLDELALRKTWPEEFGARVFKIARDAQGNRLTYMKITGGRLKVKDTLRGGDGAWEEKVNQLRSYSGEKYELLMEAEAGQICAATGLTQTYPGEGLGAEASAKAPLLQPVLNYRIQLPPECEIPVFLPKLRQLEEEEPQLHIVWNESLQEIHAQVMGEVQTEILRSLIQERFGVTVQFGTGNIVYKETIANAVEGVGHFEPLRHYAEVHLLMEPGEAGSGLAITSDCSEDQLDRNWQRLILTHLQEKEHRGVLIGAAITDMKITLIAGRAHLKHTEGGDFREATYRAVRQGLMQADCVLLEPWYDFRLEIPGTMVGRAMTDIERMHGTFQPPELFGERAVLSGHAPVATMRDYQKEVIAYSRGNGRLHVTLRGYEPCHNTEEVMEQSGYDPLRDTENPADSVFCSHGSGFVVPWDRVPDYMHLPARMIAADGAEEREEDSAEAAVQTISRREHGRKEERWLGTDEIDAILERTVSANKRDKSAPRKDGWNRRYGRTSDSSGAAGTGSSFAAAGVGSASAKGRKNPVKRDRYLLVDGYNIIFAWEDLRSLADVNIDGARGRLLDILCDYQALAGCEVIAVFDAYRVAGHQTETFDYHNIHVVYTKEAETADQYIEKFTHENGVKYDITVATSDGLEQIIIRGAGSRLLSALDLKEEIRAAKNRLREEYLEKQKTGRNYLPDLLPDEARRQLEGLGGDGQA